MTTAPLSSSPFAGSPTFDTRTESYLFRHRGMRSSARVNVTGMLALGLALSGVWILLLPWVGEFWMAIAGLLHGPFGLFDGLTEVHYTMAGRTVMIVPEPSFAAADPDAPALVGHLLACVAAFGLTLLLNEDRTPIKYLIRVAIVVHAASVAFHAIPGRTLPYVPGAYVSGMMIVGASVATLVPVILSATHFLFDFSTARKIGLALAAMAWFTLLIPVQYMVHAIVLHYGGMIFMPLLFILFGLPIEVLGFIAIYAWGMSWKGREPTDRGAPTSVSLPNSGLGGGPAKHFESYPLTP